MNYASKLERASNTNTLSALDNMKVSFLAHWVDDYDWLWWKKINIRMLSKYKPLLKCLLPINMIVANKYIRHGVGYDVLNSFNFNSLITCDVIAIRNFSYHFFQIKFHDTIRERIANAALFAQENSSVIGLGALTKAEWITQGGEWIVEHLGDKLKVPIVHGDTLTAAVVLEQALQLLSRHGSGPVFVTGSTSKIGRAVVISLAKKKIPVIMFTKDEPRFSAIKKEAGIDGHYISHSESLDSGKSCSLWITGKSYPTGDVIAHTITRETPILNFAVPNPFSAFSLSKHSHLSVYEGGLVNFTPDMITIGFTAARGLAPLMHLMPGHAYSCLAGTMVHGYKKWAHNEVGPVDIAVMPETLSAAKEIGFHITI